MGRKLAAELSRVTEAAAPADYEWLDHGDKNTADGVTVNAMRIMLNQANIDDTIVINKGGIDGTPMLFIGRKVGTGPSDAVDIAVDPIEGTRMAAMDQTNALAVLVAGDKGCSLNAPDMHMEKLIIGSDAEGPTDLNLPLGANLQNIVVTFSEPLSEPVVTILAKPRHGETIVEMRKLGVRVFAIPGDDVTTSIPICTPDSEVGVLYGIGGTLENIISAAATRALDGDMQGRLLVRHDVKGDNEESRRIGKQELARYVVMGIEADKVLRLDEMVCNDNVILSATGVAKSDLLERINREGNVATAETLPIRSKSCTIRHIQSIHYLDRKDPSVQARIL